MNFVLYPVYLRGEAYLAAKQGTAAAEFQKVLDHSGAMRSGPIGAFAQLGLARAFALPGRWHADHRLQVTTTLRQCSRTKPSSSLAARTGTVFPRTSNCTSGLGVTTLTAHSWIETTR